MLTDLPMGRAVSTMSCIEFLERYSDFRDDELLPEEAAQLRGHLVDCPSCRRYDRTVSKGVAILRDTPPPELREDFRERIRFAIYQEEYEARRRGRTLLGRGMMVGVGVAATVAVAMGMALLRERGTALDGAPVAAIESVPSPAAGSSLTRPAPLQSAARNLDEIEFLSGTNVLLYENSPLFRRHREPEILMVELR